jgi:hypothetical protein
MSTITSLLFVLALLALLPMDSEGASRHSAPAAVTGQN